MSDQSNSQPDQPAIASPGALSARAATLGLELDDLATRCRGELSSVVEAKQYVRANHLRARSSRLAGLRLDIREALLNVRRDPDAAKNILDHLEQELAEIGKAH